MGNKVNTCDVITKDYTLLFGDCLQRMKEISDGSIDLILTDPEIVELYESGLSMREISKQLNTNHKLISKILKKCGVTTRPPER